MFTLLKELKAWFKSFSRDSLEVEPIEALIGGSIRQCADLCPHCAGEDLQTSKAVRLLDGPNRYYWMHTNPDWMEGYPCRAADIHEQMLVDKDIFDKRKA